MKKRISYCIALLFILVLACEENEKEIQKPNEYLIDDYSDSTFYCQVEIDGKVHTFYQTHPPAVGSSSYLDSIFYGVGLHFNDSLNNGMSGLLISISKSFIPNELENFDSENESFQPYHRILTKNEFISIFQEDNFYVMECAEVLGGGYYQISGGIAIYYLSREIYGTDFNKNSEFSFEIIQIEELNNCNFIVEGRFSIKLENESDTKEVELRNGYFKGYCYNKVGCDCQQN